MNQTRTCRHCQHENPGDALTCEQCGVLLDSRADTTLWKTMEEVRAAGHPELRAADLKHNALYLYVAGSKNPAPIQVHGRESITLGRNPAGKSSVSALIDLTDYQAFSLGVSRQHAQISYWQGGYAIEDLDSSNGTLLNGSRLLPRQAYPLRPGDHVQLGELLMFVYFV